MASKSKKSRLSTLSDRGYRYCNASTPLADLFLRFAADRYCCKENAKVSQKSAKIYIPPIIDRKSLIKLTIHCDLFNFLWPFVGKSLIITWTADKSNLNYTHILLVNNWICVCLHKRGFFYFFHVEKVGFNCTYINLLYILNLFTVKLDAGFKQRPLRTLALGLNT